MRRSREQQAAGPRAGAARAAKILLRLALVFAAVALAHWPLLRLPYYWDEAGYYIPAAYDYLRRGTLIPYSTLSNAHPPLPSLYLAGFWRVFGFSPYVTRTAMCLVAACALLAVYRLARGALGTRSVAATVATLTALYPVWFVQSTLAHADVLAAAGTLWGFALLCEAAPATGSRTPDSPLTRLAQSNNPSTGRLLAVTLCFSLAALAKEIAVGTPLALAGLELWLASRARRALHHDLPRSKTVRPIDLAPPRQHLRTAGALLLPMLPLAAWFAYHRARTGFTFGNPEYLRYNATSTLAPPRILLALGHRLLHLTAHLNLFVPVVLALGCLLLQRVRGRAPLPAATRTRLLVVLLTNWLFFSLLGGALLTRYLLPAYPLVLLLCVSAWRQHLRRWQPVALLTGVAFLLALFFNPPYRFAPEDTLAYRDSILLQQAAIAQITARYGHPTVLTAWPATDELTRPELGYIASPLPVVAIDNFSAPQITRAQQLVEQALRTGNEPYTVALVFSTKTDPQGPFAQLGGLLHGHAGSADEQYFGFHYDLPPKAVARLLGGAVVWQAERHGQSAAVLHFNRAQLAFASDPQ